MTEADDLIRAHKQVDARRNAMKKRCERCNGGGFVATKHGSMRCPHCNGTGQRINWHARQTETEALEWTLDVIFGASVYCALVLITLWLQP